MTATKKEPYLMTRAELDDAIFRQTGIKPVPDNAPKEERDAYRKVLEIRIGLLKQELERRQAASNRTS